MEGVNVDGNLPVEVEAPDPNEPGVPDLNELPLRTVTISRPSPRRFQPRPAPHSLHTIHRTIASLMGSIATAVAFMLPLMDTSTSFLVNGYFYFFPFELPTAIRWLIEISTASSSYPQLLDG